MPNVNKEILAWAREAAGLSVQDAAQKLQLKDSQKTTAVDKLTSYENGDKSPSRSLLVRMSKQYRKPLLTFYMQKPPRRGDRGEDFRTLPADYLPEDDVYVDVLIRDIKARQSLLRETLIDEDEEQILDFIGTARVGQGVSHVAEAICQSLDFDLNAFRQSRTASEAFGYLRSIIEDAGVFVLLIGNLGSHHTNINTTVFRGFVLADNIAPFVVINDQDSKAAWSFTLLHELAHLWLGQTGVSGGFAETKLEKFCNDVASQILLPREELAGFSPSEMALDTLAQDISDFARSRKISSHLVSYRLYRQGTISHKTWIELRDHFMEQWLEYREKQKERNTQQESGPSYFVVRRHRLGEALVRLAQRMTSAGVLTTTKAGFLLGVKPLKVHKLFEPSAL